MSMDTTVSTTTPTPQLGPLDMVIPQPFLDPVDMLASPPLTHSDDSNYRTPMNTSAPLPIKGHLTLHSSPAPLLSTPLSTLHSLDIPGLLRSLLAKHLMLGHVTAK